LISSIDLPAVTDTKDMDGVPSNIKDDPIVADPISIGPDITAD
jgi:hypothetical protein